MVSSVPDPPGQSETDGRMFSPAIGIVEDPVTGNANGPMGAWLVHHNVLSHDGNVLRVKGHQGRALGRDGVIDVTVTIRDNQPEKVTISGTAVILFHAEWAIDFLMPLPDALRLSGLQPD